MIQYEIWQKKIGLDLNEKNFWADLDLDNQPLFLKTLEWIINIEDLKPDDKICKGEITIPNTIIAHWSGDVKGWGGQTYVGWEGQINYLRGLGFNVDEQESVKNEDFALQNNMEAKSQDKSLHGLYFWGHGGFGKGNDGYPAVGLSSNTEEVTELLVDLPWRTNLEGKRYQVKSASILSLNYKIGAAFLFACDTNSLKRYLVSPNGIFHGYSGTLYPIFQFYGLSSHIKPGDQGTKK